MPTKQLLNKAAEQGIISKQQVTALLAFIKSENTGSSGAGDEEQLRFVRGFGDVFITLGIILVAISFQFTGIDGYNYAIPILVFIISAEWLVRIRKLALPGIAILLCIIYFVNQFFTFSGQEKSFLNFGLITATSLAFYLRYKMPFSLLPATAGVIAILIYQIGIDIMHQPFLLASIGLCVFTLAMWFDTRDTQRQSYLSDSAFWLHLLAAPLISHGIMVTLLLSEPGSMLSTFRDMFIISFFLIFFLSALFVDRRAILISSTAYAIYAITQLAKGQFADTQSLIAFVFMAFGIFVVLFGTYWYKARSLVFGWLRGSGVARFVPGF